MIKYIFIILIAKCISACATPRKLADLQNNVFCSYNSIIPKLEENQRVIVNTN